MRDAASICDQKQDAYAEMSDGPEDQYSQIIRNKSSFGWYDWAHLFNNGVALCGQELQEEHRTESRVEDAHTCSSCLQAEARYSVKTIRSGQVRRYGPSHYIYEVADLREEKRGRDEVLTDCRRLVKKACADRSEMPHPFAAVVQEFSNIGDGKWRYFVFMESTH